MALHPSFPTSPYEPLIPEHRWFPAAESLRGGKAEQLIPPLVARIRSEVFAWRTTGYQGATATSRALLRWWFETDHALEGPDGTLSSFRYYSSQREAVETVIWLHDVRQVKDKHDLLRFDASERLSASHFQESWPRYVLKLATGAGKTKVLSLLIAWSYFHKLYEPGSTLEFEMGLFPAVLDEAKAKGIEITSKYIPKDVFDKRAVDRGQVVFHDISYIQATPKYDKKHERRVQVTLEDFSVYYSQGAMEEAIDGLKEGKSTVVCEAGKLIKVNKDKNGVVTKETLTKKWTDWVDLGKFGIHTTRKRLIQVQRDLKEEGKPFRAFEVLNLGRYERQAYLNVGGRLSGAAKQSAIDKKEREFRSLILRAYKAKPLDGAGFFHGTNGNRYVAIGPINLPVGRLFVEEVIVECRKLGATRADILAFARNILLVAPNIIVLDRLRTDFDGLKIFFNDPILPENCDEVGEWLQKQAPELSGGVLVIHTKNNGDIAETATGKKQDELVKLRKDANTIDSSESPYKAIVSVLMLKEGWDVRNVTVIVGLRPYEAKSNILSDAKT